MSQTLFLSKLVLNPRLRSVVRELNNPYELHRTIMRAFPDAMPKETERILFRLDVAARGTTDYQLPSLLVQSTLRPDWGFLDEKEGFEQVGETKDLSELSFSTGQYLRFSLRANTVKRLPRGAEKLAGQRVGLYREIDQIEWLSRKAQQAGFLIPVEALIRPVDTRPARKPGAKGQITLHQVDFSGILQVQDPLLFRQQLGAGIGPAKGLGCGLLLLASA